MNLFQIGIRSLTLVAQARLKKMQLWRQFETGMPLSLSNSGGEEKHGFVVKMNTVSGLHKNQKLVRYYLKPSLMIWPEWTPVKGT